MHRRKGICKDWEKKKTIETVCSNGCKSLHLGDIRRTLPFFRRLVLVKKYTVSLTLWQVQEIFGNENPANDRNNDFVNVQPEYKRSFFNT